MKKRKRTAKQSRAMEPKKKPRTKAVPIYLPPFLSLPSSLTKTPKRNEARENIKHKPTTLSTVKPESSIQHLRVIFLIICLLREQELFTAFKLLWFQRFWLED
jgi:hypothetical protein